MILSDRILGLIDDLEREKEKYNLNLSVVRMSQTAAVIIDSTLRERGIIPQYCSFEVCVDGSIDLDFQFADMELQVNIDNNGDDLIQTISQKEDSKYYQEHYSVEKLGLKIIEILNALGI